MGVAGGIPLMCMLLRVVVLLAYLVLCKLYYAKRCLMTDGRRSTVDGRYLSAEDIRLSVDGSRSPGDAASAPGRAGTLGVQTLGHRLETVFYWHLFCASTPKRSSKFMR